MNRIFLLTTSLLLCTISACFNNESSEVEDANVAFDVSSDGNHLVFSSAMGDLFLFELGTKKVTQLVQTADEESTPAFSPDGKTVIYAVTTEGQRGSHIFTTSLDGKHREQLTHDAGVSDSRPRFSPDGSRIAFARAHTDRPYSMGGRTWDDWDIYVMNADGSHLARLSRKSYYGIGGVAFAPDSKSIFYSADDNRAKSNLIANVFNVLVDGMGAPQPGVPQPAAAGKYAEWAGEPHFSPDGNTMVAISERAAPYNYDLILIDRASGKTSSLGATTISSYNTNPVFKSDGKRILFLAGTETNSGSRPIFSLWSIDLDGKNAIEIAGSQLFTNPMKWSPKR